MIVTLALERRYKLHEGTVPRLNRSLIGDVTVDMMPGTGPGYLETSKLPALAPIIHGAVAPDPSKALAAATKAFESAGDTLKAIDQAAAGLAKISQSAGKLDDFLASVADAGRNVSNVAQGLERVIKTNEGDLQPTMANLRQIAEKLDEAIDQDRTQDRHRAIFVRLGPSRCRARPDRSGAQRPGSPVDHRPATDIGQAVRRINLVAADLELLSSKLRNGRGGLNTDGSHPEAPHPVRAARQFQRDGDLRPPRRSHSSGPS